MTFESQGRDLNLAADFVLVDDAFEELLFCVLCQIVRVVILGELSNFTSFHVAELNL